MLNSLPVRLRCRIASATGLDVVGDLGDQDDVGAARDAGAERQPAGIVAHDLDHDDAVMAVRGAVQAVDRVGDDPECRVEAEGDVGALDVVVDRLGQGHDVEALLDQALGVLLRAAAADADQRVEMMPLVGLDDHVGHVQGLPADRHAVRLVAAGAEDGAADREDAGQLCPRERRRAVLDQTTKAVAIADHMHPVGADRGFADAADRGVQAGAVAARGQDADRLDHAWSPRCHGEAFLLRRDTARR